MQHAQLLPEAPPERGDLVQVRSRRWLVEDVDAPSRPGNSAVVHLACADPRSTGGTDHLDNLVLTCRHCTRRKGAKNYRAFKAELAGEAKRAAFEQGAITSKNGAGE